MADLTAFNGQLPVELLRDLSGLLDMGALQVARNTVATSDTTATVITSITMPTDNRTMIIFALVTGCQSDGSVGAGYTRVAAVRRASGTLTQVGATVATVTLEDNAGTDCTVVVSGTSVQVKVTGLSATAINWTSEVFYIGQ